MRKNLLTDIERLLKEGLSNAEKAGIDENSLSCFQTQVGKDYEEGNVLFLGRATNGWDQNNPKTLKQLIELNDSQLIRVIRDISRYLYGPQGEDYIAWTNVCRIADCDSGNPGAKLYKASKEQNDKLFEIDMEELQPSIVVAIVGDSVAEDGWQASVWEYINKFTGQYHEVGQKVICQRDDRKYTATPWRLEREGTSPTWFIFADRPEGIRLDVYTKALINIIDDIRKGI